MFLYVSEIPVSIRHRRRCIVLLGSMHIRKIILRSRKFNQRHKKKVRNRGGRSLVGVCPVAKCYVLTDAAVIIATNQRELYRTEGTPTHINFHPLIIHALWQRN